jgi:hypothetical protein
MSFITTKPIEWQVHRLMCECGGEFKHVMNINYADKPFAHACDQCGLQDNTVNVYPKTVWEETK